MSHRIASDGQLGGRSVVFGPQLSGLAVTGIFLVPIEVV